MRLTVVLLLIGCFWLPLAGQNYTATSYTTANSPLPSNNLKALYLDNNGILWIGSDAGLTGYNGSAWITYDVSNSVLAANDVRSIQVNSETLWLGTQNGLSLGQINTFDNINWDSTYQVQGSGLINNRINAINLDSLGALWVCTDSGMTVITDTSLISFSSSEPLLSHNTTLAINQQPLFMQYVGTEGGGVSRLYNDIDGISGASTILKQWTSFQDSTGKVRGLLSDTVTAVLVDRNGDRWFGTKQGLSFHTGIFLKNPYSWINYTTETGLIDNNIQALAEDTSGAIWIATSAGLSKLIAEDTTWANFTDEDGLVSNNIRSISVTEDADIWLATDSGLSKLSISPTAISDKRQAQPHMFEVYPAYPNPFNMSTTIEFHIPAADKIKITIFDVSGREVNTIINTPFMPGNYKVTWNGKNSGGSEMASGIYFASLTSTYQKSILKLILIK